MDNKSWEDMNNQEKDDVLTHVSKYMVLSVAYENEHLIAKIDEDHDEITRMYHSDFAKFYDIDSLVDTIKDLFTDAIDTGKLVVKDRFIPEALEDQYGDENNTCLSESFYNFVGSYEDVLDLFGKHNKLGRAFVELREDESTRSSLYFEIEKLQAQIEERWSEYNLLRRKREDFVETVAKSRLISSQTAVREGISMDEYETAKNRTK